MASKQSYYFVGAKAIAARVESKYEGIKIHSIEDIRKWIKDADQAIYNDTVIATFIISEKEELVINDRHSEHVMCAGGRDVLSAGEISFCFEKDDLYVNEITNQSTGYCPRTSSWEVVKMVLDKIGIEHPDCFTSAYEFRYCENCKTKNLIKENVYECAVCEEELNHEWNIDKIKRQI